MIIRTLLLLCATILLTACGSSATVERSWIEEDIQDRDLRGVLVLAMASTEEGRRAFEEEFTEEIRAHDIHAVASYTLKGGTEIDKDDIRAMGAEAGVDTVLVTLFAGRDHSEVLHPGRRYYGVAPVYGRDPWGRGHVYGVPYYVGETQDFWAQHNSIHLSARLYEIRSEDKLWQADSGMEEESDVSAMRSAFIRSFMQDLAEQGLVD